MIQIEKFTFGPFSENTYVLYDEHGEAIIIDPGMYDQAEELEIFAVIERHGLKPKAIVNTHAHLDHIFGVQACIDKYDIPFLLHELDMPTLSTGPIAAEMYGVELTPAPAPDEFLKEGELFMLGSNELEIRFCPGHCPGHVVFVNHLQQFVIGGDVLFKDSVGRIDLPGGNGPDLDKSIREQLYTLPDPYQVHPGHGPATTIGYEKVNNMYVSETESRLL